MMSARVCITTIQRLYSMLRGEELTRSLDEKSGYEIAPAKRAVPVVAYNPRFPSRLSTSSSPTSAIAPSTTCGGRCSNTLTPSSIGLTATPSKQTFGFFNQNLVMEYNHEQAVADGVNVDFDVYRIRTLISEHGATVNAGFYVDKRDRLSRRVRWEQLDEELSYTARQLDRDVVAKDQIRTIIQAFRDRLFTEIFPGRTEVPKTLIFAKDDSHADDIVQIVREEFGKGNDFAQKITYRTGTARVVTKRTTEDGREVEDVTWVNTGIKPEDLLSSFRNSYNPRIAVTVDMIATGTDIKPLEIVFFMRTVRSRNFFEQMKGRGTRVITPDDLQAVTPDAKSKTHFIIVDAVGLSEEEMSDTRPLERKKTVSFEKLLEAVSFGNREPDVLSSLASRLARLDRELSEDDRTQVTQAAGQPLAQITSRIVEALDPDVHLEAAKKATGTDEPSPDQVKQSATKLIQEAAQPIAANPNLRNRLIEIRRSYEQTIDTVSKDQLLSAGHDPAARQKAQSIVQSFEQFIRENKNEITALQILYSRPYRQRLTLKEIDELAKTIERPPRAWTADRLWQAYQALDRSKVRGSGQRVLADLVSLVRFAMHEQSDLHPFRDDVHKNFARWMAQQESNGRQFTTEQRQWLEAIRDHVAASLTIESEDFEYEPFVQRGGLGKAYQVFGKDLEPILKELNEVLVQ
jgi:type I restriction enzyme R subunit